MNKKQILEKALRIAYKNGWRPLHQASFNNCTVQQWEDDKLIGIAVLFPNRNMTTSWVRELEGIIYNHDFAKALWKLPIKTAPIRGMKSWQGHLQAMIVADDPIKYLGENI